MNTTERDSKIAGAEARMDEEREGTWTGKDSGATLREVWDRMNKPQTIADYSLSITLPQRSARHSRGQSTE